MLAGIACFLVYAPSASLDSVNIDVAPAAQSAIDSGTGSLAAAPGPLPKPPKTGFLERVRRLQLADVTSTVDRLGLVFGDLVAQLFPFGSVSYRLSLSAALLGATSVSLLVAIMLRLETTRSAAMASALGFAFHDVAWTSAVTPSSRMAYVPLLLLSISALLWWSSSRRRGWLWFGGGLWGLCTASEPLLLCALPAVVWFCYQATRRRGAPGPVPILMMAVATALLGVILGSGGLGLRTWPTAPDTIRLVEASVQGLGPLGLLLLCFGLFGLLGSPAPAGRLLSFGLFGLVAWLFCAEAVHKEQLLTTLLFACPIIGAGMSSIARSVASRVHTVAALTVCLVFPMVNFVTHFAGVRELRDDYAVWWEQARSLADTLPADAVVVTVAGADEPIPRLWRFAATAGRPIAEVSWNAGDVMRLRAVHSVFVFEPSRQLLELLGFQFEAVGQARADFSLATYLSRLPRGTFVAAAAGSGITEASRSELLTVFHEIGGGRALVNDGPFYGIVGRTGGAVVVEKANDDAVQIHVTAGDVVDKRGTLFPATLDVESVPAGARIAVNGVPVLQDVTDMAIVLLGPSARESLTAFARNGELLVPLDISDRTPSRLDAWVPCTPVQAHEWVDVSVPVARGNFGFGFSDRPHDGSLALYLTADQRLRTLEADTFWTKGQTMDLEVFDLTDPMDAAALAHLIALDGLESFPELRRQRFVHLAHVDVDSAEPPFAALRLDGDPAFAIARRLSPVEVPPVNICLRAS